MADGGASAPTGQDVSGLPDGGAGAPAGQNVSGAAHEDGPDSGATLGAFDRDTAVTAVGAVEDAAERVLEAEQSFAAEQLFAAEVSPNWRAGRGPHGGYLAAMLLRALIQAVADPARAPRSLTIHYLRAPEPGPVLIRVAIERAGRSLSTLSARMEQDGTLIALALSAFSVPWNGPEISEIQLPAIEPPSEDRVAGGARQFGAPPFTDHVVMQPRIGGVPFSGPERAMEFGAWLGLAEPRAIDAISLAFFSDALIPSPFMRMQEFTPAPTIDLTIHFRVALPREQDPDRSHGSSNGEPHQRSHGELHHLMRAEPRELCFARVHAGVIHDGFFEEDGVIWATDGTVLAQSRQLAILLPIG